MLRKILAATALLLVTLPAFAADNAQIDALSEQIKTNPHDTQLYTQRLSLHDAAGNYAAALADLRQTCSMERDADIAEMCLAEAKEYAAKHNLQ